jgi:hypothetical protein
MNKLLLLAGVGLLTGAAAGDGPADRAAADAAKMASALAGYEQSGPAVSCVNERDLHGNKSAGEHAIIFEGTTSATLWVNHPPGGCPELDSGRALVIRTPSTRLCTGDIANVIDPVARITYGSCGLGEFTPYRRVRR